MVTSAVHLQYISFGCRNFQARWFCYTYGIRSTYRVLKFKGLITFRKVYKLDACNNSGSNNDQTHPRVRGGAPRQ